MKHNNLLEISTVTVASSSNSISALGFDHSHPQGVIIPQLQERISDLEQHPGATAKLPKADARAIHGILVFVKCESEALVSPSGSSSVSSNGISSNGKSKKKKESSSLKKEAGSGGGGGTLDTPKDIFQETIQTARELHDRHSRQLKGISSISTTTSTSSASSTIFEDTNNPSTTLLASDSEPCLVAVNSQQLISEATTRLLRAETELGLLKMVMTQNQEEISGLEEDVFRAQRELKNHRKIKSLEKQIKKAEANKDEAEKLVKLEQDLEEREKNLDQKRDSYQQQEQDMREGLVRDLEAEIELLKGELAAQEVRMHEMEQQAIEAKQEDDEMVEHLDRQHRKATVVLKASLLKAWRTNIRLSRDVSALAKKMVTVESLNKEYAQQTSLDRAQLADLQ
ncbi:hypothetical protein BGW39_008921 [Mortierella sp. 14UC]|nr:hypothetical protein BGW39_008921 [Mortierella sp. 14UC]